MRKFRRLEVMTLTVAVLLGAAMIANAAERVGADTPKASEAAVSPGAGLASSGPAGAGHPGSVAGPSGAINPWAFSVREDMGRMATPRAFAVLGAGAALAAGALAVEDANAQAETFEDYGVVPDVGNTYGSWEAMLAGTVGLVSAGEIAGRPGITAAGVDLGRALVYSGVAASALKVGFGRTRPNGDKYSFPSGHTTAAFAAAPVLTRHFGPWVGVAAYTLGGATMIGRMAERKHYLSDVVFGAALGWVIGDAVVGPRPDADALSHLTIEPGRVALQVHF